MLSARALLFDLDGVLADSTASIEAHWRRWAVRHGLDADTFTRAIHGRRGLDVIRELAPQLDAERESADLAAAQAADTNGVIAAPGAGALLARLPNAAWAVVTSGRDAVARARLRAAGLPVPLLLISAEDVAAGKPAPEGYLAGAAGLGVPPAECVVVEDAPVGVDAARAAGMRCVGLATTHSPSELSAADLVVPSLAELRVAVERVEGQGAVYRIDTA